MLPSGDPVSNKLGGWGEARAVPAAAEPGQQPTSEDRQRIADLHEPPAGLPAGGWMRTEIGVPGCWGTSLLSFSPSGAACRERSRVLPCQPLLPCRRLQPPRPQCRPARHQYHERWLRRHHHWHHFRYNTEGWGLGCIGIWQLAHITPSASSLRSCYLPLSLLCYHSWPLPIYHTPLLACACRLRDRHERQAAGRQHDRHWGSLSQSL